MNPPAQTDVDRCPKRNSDAVQVAQRYPHHPGAVINLHHYLEGHAGSQLGMFLAPELGAGNKVHSCADGIGVRGYGLVFCSGLLAARVHC